AISPVDLGKINYVAWSVVVFYKLQSELARTLSLVDGFAVVDRNTPLSLKLENFLPLPQAGFKARIGVLAYEGDSDIAGDSLRFNGQPLGDNAVPMDNFFNSSRTRLGLPVSVTGDLPQLSGGAGSMGSLDLHEMDVTALVPQGSKSAMLDAATVEDVFYWG